MTSAVHDYQYSVQVKSRFDLLGNDDYNSEDPEHVIRKLKSQKHEAKPVTTPQESVASKPVSEKRPEKAESGNRDQVRGKGNRGRGGFTRSRPAPVGGQRQFDRHSGSDKTGIKAVVKKDGHGTGNWGTIEDELEAQTADTSLEAPAEEEAPVEVTPDAEPEPVEEEPKTLTLQEYKEQQKASKTKVHLSTKGSRRANDGKNVFSNMVEVHKSKPVESKVEVVLKDEKQNQEESKPVFFEFGRGKSTGRGRGPRPSGPGDFNRGRGTGPRFHPREQEHAEEAGASAPEAERSSRGGRGGERGGRGGERVGRGGGRGRGAPRGTFNPERGGGRGGAAGDRPAFRGGERGGRGSRGGPRGGFRGGRDQHDGERRPGSSRSAAPIMDSEADFPALK